MKSNVMQKLVRINIIIHLKVNNHWNTFEATLTTVLHALWKPDLNKQKDFERLVLYRNGAT